MSQHSTHFLSNIQAFSPLKLWLPTTTSRPTSPLSWRKKKGKTFSLPVKTILLFNPTGSQRGRLKEGVGVMQAHCPMSPLLPSHPPPLFPPTDHHSAMSENEEKRGEKREERREKEKQPQAEKPTHFTHHSSRRKQLWPGIPLTVQEYPGQSSKGTSAWGTDISHSLDTSIHLNKR